MSPMVPILDATASSPAPAPRRGRSVAGGFTLIEVLTVVAVIAVLMGIVVSVAEGAKQRVAIARAKSELALLAQALEDYRRHYGDYPQTGLAGQAPAVAATIIGITQAQSLLFNALTGVYGPTNFTTRLNGPVFVDVSKFTLEAALNNNTFGVPVGSPPQKMPVANCFLDPWGRRYVYYYKALSPSVRTAAVVPSQPAIGLGQPAAGFGQTAIVPSQPTAGAGQPVLNNWRANSYVLYSAGPDGQHTAPNTGTGLYATTTQTSGTNADNLFAENLP